MVAIQAQTIVRPTADQATMRRRSFAVLSIMQPPPDGR